MIVYLHLPAFYVWNQTSERPVVIAKGRRVLDANLKARTAGVEEGTAISVARSILAKNPEPVAPLFIDWREEEYADRMREWLDLCVPFSDVIEPADQHCAYVDLSAHPHPEEVLAPLISTLGRFGPQCGIGRCKWMARASHSQGDKEGLAYYAPNAFLDELPTRSLSPVERATCERLEFLGYRTAAQIQRVPLETLVSQFGQDALTIRSAAHGMGTERVVALYPFGTVRARFTFEGGADSSEAIANGLRVVSKQLSDALGKDDLASTKVRMTVQYEDSQEVRSREFSKPLQSEFSIRFALGMLSKFEAPVVQIRVELLDVRKSSRKQSSLYRSRTDSGDVLEQSASAVRGLYGERAICKGAEIPLTRRQRLLRAWSDATGWR